MKSGPYYKAPNTGKAVHSASFLDLSFLVQCAKCSWQHTVWSGRHTQVGRLTRGFEYLRTRKFMDLWIRETCESLKITQISVSPFNRPQPH